MAYELSLFTEGTEDLKVGDTFSVLGQVRLTGSSKLGALGLTITLDGDSLRMIDFSGESDSDTDETEEWDDEGGVILYTSLYSSIGDASFSCEVLVKEAGTHTVEAELQALDEWGYAADSEELDTTVTVRTKAHTPTATKLNLSSQRVRCPICGEWTLKNRAAWAAHMETEHGASGGWAPLGPWGGHGTNPQECYGCGAKFQTEAELVQHLYTRHNCLSA